MGQPTRRNKSYRYARRSLQLQIIAGLNTWTIPKAKKLTPNFYKTKSRKFVLKGTIKILW
jgi:hypothetical protein